MNLTFVSYSVIIFITLSGIVDEWAPNPVTSWWRVLAAVWIVLLLFEWRTARQLRFTLTRHIKPVIHLGRPGLLGYQLHNLSNRRLQCRSIDRYPDTISESPASLTWNLAAGMSAQNQQHITPTQLGELHWQDIQLRILGFFGLAWWSRLHPSVTTAEVIPDRLYTHEQQRSATAHQGDISRRLLGIGTEFIGLREYLPGDPLHYIDWKASARSHKTIVRLFSDEHHLELMIIIDAGRTSNIQAGELTRLGHYINIASRLAQKALLNGDQVGIIVFADTVLASMHRLRGHHGLQQLRAILSQISPVARESNPLPAILRARQLASLRSLVVMLTDLDDGDAAAQLFKAMKLLQPKHQPMLAAISDARVRRLGEAAAANWLDPYHSLAAKEVLENWRHTRVRLERMGIPVVLTDLKYLDQQVLANYDRLKERKRI